MNKLKTDCWRSLSQLLCCASSSTWKWKCSTPIDRVIRFTASTTWHQKNFNLTWRSRTLAMGARLPLTYTNFLTFCSLFYPSRLLNLLHWFQEVQEQLSKLPSISLRFFNFPFPSHPYPNHWNISVLNLTQSHCVMNLNELVHENLCLTRGYERLLKEFWVGKYFSKVLTCNKRRDTLYW